jgi:hypothetical protein
VKFENQTATVRADKKGKQTLREPASNAIGRNTAYRKMKHCATVHGWGNVGIKIAVLTLTFGRAVG